MFLNNACVENPAQDICINPINGHEEVLLGILGWSFNVEGDFRYNDVLLYSLFLLTIN